MAKSKICNNLVGPSCNDLKNIKMIRNKLKMDIYARYNNGRTSKLQQWSFLVVAVLVQALPARTALRSRYVLGWHGNPTKFFGTVHSAIPLSQT